MLQVWWWTPWTCLNWRRHHDVKFALSQLPSSCFGIPTCCSCDCSCTCNCRGLILHPGLFKMLLLNIHKVPAQHIMLRLLGLQFCFLYGMQPTWCCLTLGCAETKQFRLMYHTWSTFVCLEVTMLQIWRWTPWTCLNWRRHHDVKFALSQLPSSCPQVLNLTTSKTQQFSEFSSIVVFDNVKNDAILQGFLQNWKVECRAGGLVPLRFAIFWFYASKLLRLPRKSDTGSYEVLHLSRKIISANLKIWCSKMHPFWWTCLLYCACHGKCIFSDPLQISHACHRFWTCYKTLTFGSLLTRCTIPCACHAKWHLNVQKFCKPLIFFHFWLRNVLRATTACTFSTYQLPKLVRSSCVLYILTSKCALSHNGVHFFDISSSKSGPELVFLCILTSKFASRHNSVHFFDISTSKSGPELVRFAHFDFEMCFAPQRCAIFHLSSAQRAPHPPL